MVYKVLRRKHYPSDRTDEQWAIVGPLLPPAKQSQRGGRPRKVDMREVLNIPRVILVASHAIA
jgi:transposase